MENINLVKNIINVCSRLENLCEGFDVDSKSTLISSELKILLSISEAVKVSPSMLIDKVGLAKSNIALITRKLVNDGLINKEKDEFDNRVVFFTITEKGQNKLDESLKTLNFNFTRELAYKNNFKEIEKCLNELKKLID